MQQHFWQCNLHYLENEQTLHSQGILTQLYEMSTTPTFLVFKGRTTAPFVSAYLPN